MPYGTGTYGSQRGRPPRPSSAAKKAARKARRKARRGAKKKK